MHDAPRPSWKQVQAIIDRAVAAGTHGPIENWRTVWEGCGQWVTGIWTVTPAGTELCRKCADPDYAKAKQLKETQ